MRKDFADILSGNDFDIGREYSNLYRLAYGEGDIERGFMQFVDDRFQNVPFRGTSLTLYDFNERYAFHFDGRDWSDELDDLLSFCEYLYNFADVFPECSWDITRQVELVAEAASHQIVKRGGYYVLAPIDSAAILASEIAPVSLSTDILAYQHRSLRGDLEGKKTIILKLVGELEPMRGQVKSVSGKLADDLFYLVNNANMRHNNFTLGSKKYSKVFSGMGKDELESWYDRIYELCITAFPLLEYSEWKDEVDQLKQG